MPYEEGKHPRDRLGRWGEGIGEHEEDLKRFKDAKDRAKSKGEKAVGGEPQPVGMREQKSEGWTSRYYSFGKNHGEKAIGSWDLSPGNEHLDGDSVTRVLGDKGWVAGRDHIAKQLGLDKLKAPDDHEIVYRFSHKAKDGLSKKNAGNLEGALQYVDEASEKEIEHGQVLTAYAVRMPKKFKSYEELEGGSKRGSKR